MCKQGQIIEISAISSIYNQKEPVFHSKRDELVSKAARRNYDLFDGFLVGEHSGTALFKLGQRKGISVCGKNAPLYVIGSNAVTNQLFVGEGEKHPGLWTTVLSFSEHQMKFSHPGFHHDTPELGMEVSIHSSMTDIDMKATLYRFDHLVFLEFEAPVPIAMQDHALEIYFNDHAATTIKIN